jgi:hypothetical protein
MARSSEVHPQSILGTPGMIINTSRDLETDWRELEADRAGIFG